MKNIMTTVPVQSASEEYTIWPLFDIHYGAAACNLKRLRADIQAIADDPYALWLGGGDMIEAINHLDPRYDPKVVEVGSTLRQVSDFADLVAPIYHKCIGLLEGNHEFQFTRHHDVSAYHLICQSLERRNPAMSGASDEQIRKAGSRLALGVQGYMSLQFKRTNGTSNTFVIYAEHGAGGGDLRGGDALMLGRLLGKHPYCRVALCGHRHQVVVVKDSGDRPIDNGEVEVYSRYSALCGAYLEPFLPPDEDGYPRDTYPERKHKAPIDANSYIRLKIKPYHGNKHRMMYTVVSG